MTRSFLWVLLVITAACGPGGWQPQEMIVPGNLPREQQIKIWSGETEFRWHAVIYTRDSITGIPYKMPATCDACRLAVSRFATDSIHVGHYSSPRENYEMLGMAAAALVLVTVALAVLHVH